MMSFRSCLPFFFFSILSFQSTVFAEHKETQCAGDKFPFSAQQIAEQVLIDAKGILTITLTLGDGKAGWNTKFSTYCRSGEEWKPGEQTTCADWAPISGATLSLQGTCSETNSICRYPIVELNDPYLKVVIDPEKNKSIWINKDELRKKKFLLNAILFEELGLNPSYFLNMYAFFPSKLRKVYQEPDLKSHYRLFNACLISERYGDVTEEGACPFQDRLVVLDQKNGFLRIGKLDPGLDSSITMAWRNVYEIGWIRMRDDAGRLTFWLVDSLPCSL